jgi:hypothetical protein
MRYELLCYIAATLKKLQSIKIAEKHGTLSQKVSYNAYAIDFQDINLLKTQTF